MAKANLCDSCARKTCPENGSFDGMLGPTIGCPKYWPTGWTGIVFAPLYWLASLVNIF
jgi:hypothetical protein